MQAVSTTSGPEPTTPHGQKVNVGAIAWGLGRALSALFAGAGFTVFVFRRRLRLNTCVGNQVYPASFSTHIPDPRCAHSQYECTPTTAVAQDTGYIATAKTTTSTRLSLRNAFFIHRSAATAVGTGHATALVSQIQALEVLIHTLCPINDVRAVLDSQTLASLRSTEASSIQGNGS